jgi:nucleoid DNA-binding protein
MTHNEMVKEVADVCGETQRVVDGVLRASAEVVKKKLAAGEDVRLFGIGRFHVVERKARMARNQMCANPGPIHVPARKAIKFNVSSAVLDAVRGE